MYELLVALLLLLFLQYRHLLITESVTASNGKKYNVMNFADKQIAANNMGELDSFARNFISGMKSRRDKLHPLMEELLHNLQTRYKGGDSLSENSPQGFDTSYTSNKGKYIVMCMREKAPPFKLHDMNVMKYVFLHELAHVAMTFSDPRHSLNFWERFKIILVEAQAQGIYSPVDYKRSPTKYCGTIIRYNPYFDDSIYAQRSGVFG